MGRILPLPAVAGSHRNRQTGVTPPWNVGGATQRRAPPRTVGNAIGATLGWHQLSGASS